MHFMGNENWSNSAVSFGYDAQITNSEKLMFDCG